jgi:hypothetical protein
VRYTTQTSCANPTPGGSATWCPSANNTLGVITVGTGTQSGWTEEPDQRVRREELHGLWGRYRARLTRHGVGWGRCTGVPLGAPG